MGARCVVTRGRNADVLADLGRRSGERVAPVRLTDDAACDNAAMRDAAPCLIDAVLDFLPPSVEAAVARTAIMAVRLYGRAVLMGGVGMLGGEDLALPYPWIMRNLITMKGQWMYPREAIAGMMDLVRGGLLDLGQFSVTEFTLDDANKVVTHAAANAGPFRLIVLKP